jgi:thymidylate kinase
MKNLMIVLESLDGIGKSTIGPALAEKMGGVYIATPIDEYQKYRKMANSNNVARFFYFLSAVVSASDVIRRLLQDGKTVIVDRYIDSTFACHEALGVNTTNLVNEEALDIVQPDYIFYLTIPDDERHKRLTQRPTTDYDRYLEADEQLQLRTHQAFLARPIIVLDITSLDVPACVNKILKKIESLEASYA